MTQPQVSTVVADPASVDAAITSRMSARAFLPQPVPRATLEHLLEVASRAPSGTNTQPWKVYVLQGASRDSLVEKCCAAHDELRADPSLAEQYREEYDYYPEQWVSPYIDRRRKVGWDLYSLLGIAKTDKAAMHAMNVTVIALEWETPDAFESTQGVSTDSISDDVFASTIQAGPLDGLVDDLDDAAIERSIAEINEAIRRSAARKA